MKWERRKTREECERSGNKRWSREQKPLRHCAGAQKETPSFRVEVRENDTDREKVRGEIAQGREREKCE